MDATISPSIGGDGVLTLALAGEPDLGSRGFLREAITVAIRTDDVIRVVVDLETVTFLDSSAIGVLIGGWRLAQQLGKGFGLSHARGVVLRVLETTALWGHLGIADDASRPAPTHREMA